MRKIKSLVGITALILGWWFAHPAQAANPLITTDQALTVLEIVGTFAELGHLFRPANDNSAGSNNLYFGFAQSATGFDVHDGIGVCVKNDKYPQISACLQQIAGLSLNDCSLRMAVSSAAIQNTPIVAQHTVNPLSGTAFPTQWGALGGLCYQPDMSGNAYFAGYLQHVFFIHLGNNLPIDVCQWLINQCTPMFGTGCSCGLIRSS